MKKSMVIAVLTVTALFTVSAADEGTKPDKPSVATVNPMAPIMKKPDMIEAKVLKVYSAEDDGAKFKAYAVKWKDSEVVVTDPMGMSDKKEGDTIKIMIHRMEMPNRGKMIRFTMTDFPGINRPASKEPKLKTPEAPTSKPADKPANP